MRMTAWSAKELLKGAAAGKASSWREIATTGAKARTRLWDLRGAEAPLFHVTGGILDCFRNLVVQMCYGAAVSKRVIFRGKIRRRLKPLLIRFLGLCGAA
jgi:hypothetical protein